MHRRTFITLTATAAALPSLSFAASDYTPGLVQKHLAQGDTVFLDFKAEWCSTCRAQERVINALRKDNPAYNANIVFINVDWDDYGKSDLVKSLSIPRRSTLVALKGDAEIGRVVAQTSSSSIKKLMDDALGAATSNS